MYTHVRVWKRSRQIERNGTSAEPGPEP